MSISLTSAPHCQNIILLHTCVVQSKFFDQALFILKITRKMDVPISATDDQYRHEPLDTTKRQIRLLKVSRSDSADIEGTLTTFDLDVAPEYTAVSYRWGSPIADHTILVNRHPLRISANLFSFLETHRREDVDEYLWIDQICIAQSNKAERNHQVGLMSTIYSRCECTIVWLNDDKDHYPVIAEDFNRTHSRKALLGLLNDSYFKRLWIVQEVILSSSIWVLISGNVWIKWETISECFLTKAWGPEHAILKSLFRPETMFHSRKITLQRLTLGACILTFSGQLCEDPRDKVYGLLGMVLERENLIVDYNKTPKEVYIDAVIAVGTYEREECAERLGDLFKIPSEERKQLLALLNLLQPVSFMGQLSTLQDGSPKTAFGSGLVSSIGLAFAAEPASADEGPGVPLDAQDKSWTDELNGTEGQIFLHEQPVCTGTEIQDEGPHFDTILAILEFHHRLHEADWDRKHPHFCGQDWQVQEDLAKMAFWTYVAVRKDEQEQSQERARPLSCRRRWCFGYQGQVYEYGTQPQWEVLFGFRPDTSLMQYVAQACSKVRTIRYPRPIEVTGGIELHWVKLRQQSLDAECLSKHDTSATLSNNLIHWKKCSINTTCVLYGANVTIEKDRRQSVLARNPELRETPW